MLYFMLIYNIEASKFHSVGNKNYFNYRTKFFLFQLDALKVLELTLVE
jgi:hypothetical protein